LAAKRSNQEKALGTASPTLLSQQENCGAKRTPSAFAPVGPSLLNGDYSGASFLLYSAILLLQQSVAADAPTPGC